MQQHRMTRIRPTGYKTIYEHVDEDTKGLNEKYSVHQMDNNSNDHISIRLNRFRFTRLHAVVIHTNVTY